MTQSLPDPCVQWTGARAKPMPYRVIALILLAAVAAVVSIATALTLLGTALGWVELAAGISFCVGLLAFSGRRPYGRAGQIALLVRFAVSAAIAFALWWMLTVSGF